MNDKDYKLTKLRMQAQVLYDLMQEYRGRTIDNILTNLKARIEYYENNRSIPGA